MTARRCWASPRLSCVSEPAPELLRDHTTLRLGGPARQWVEATTEAQLVAAVAAADASGTPLLLLGGGSNLVVADEGFDGTVVHVATRGVTPDADACEIGPDGEPAHCGGMIVRVAAGEPWDDFVALAVAREWIGVEALSGIPGLVGGTPVQNVGAYGQEVADTIASVRTWDRADRTQRTFAAADCGFGYRTSRFKAEPGRYVVLEVTFQLTEGSLGAPVRYAELARTLGVEVGSRAPSAAVRDAVLALRRGKGMVLDADDHDTWSAGSFFTNPILSADQAAALPADAPRWPQPDGNLKSSAAWLIEHAGFAKGFGAGRAQLSSKHTLALTNRGGATTADLLALAREVRDGVERAFAGDAGQMGRRHPARSQDREPARVRAAHVPDAQRGIRPDPHLLNQPIMHDGEKVAASGVEKQDEAEEQARAPGVFLLSAHAAFLALEDHVGLDPERGVAVGGDADHGAELVDGARPRPRRLAVRARHRNAVPGGIGTIRLVQRVDDRGGVQNLRNLGVRQEQGHAAVPIPASAEG